MKRYHFLTILVFCFLWVISCSQNEDVKTNAEQQIQTFTCPMHPQVVKNEMSTCPICGMDLVPFEKNSTEKILVVNAQRQTLANIRTMIVGEEKASAYKILNARLVINPEQSSYQSAKIGGRITKLYIQQTGLSIKKGQPLYLLYSEELATLQQEYLMALAQEKQFEGSAIEKQLVAAAKQKLLLYGQSVTQIAQLEKTGQKSPYVTVYASQAGTVAEIFVTQGQYIEEGTSIFKLEDYSSLWVEADVYASEIAHIKEGQQVQVRVVGYEDQPQTITIEFIAPVLQAGSQLAQLRGRISNPNTQWQAGLQANLILPKSQSNTAVYLPIDAVIREEKGQHVWIKSEKDTFEPRLVTIGTESGDSVEITSGLALGEEVVITGSYLLYSEYVLKKGKNPLEKH